MVRTVSVRDDSSVSVPWSDYEVLASGTFAGGFSWRLRGSGDAGELTTLLDITTADGAQVGGGGLGGPALYPNDPVNVSVHRSDSGPTYLVGRAAHDVRKLRLTLESGEETFVLPVAQSATLTFFAAIMPAPVLTIAGLDADGRAMSETPVPPLFW